MNSSSSARSANPDMPDPQVGFAILGNIMLAGTMIAVPFLRINLGGRYLFGVPTIFALLIQLLVLVYAKTNLDRGLLQLLLLSWVFWTPVRLIWASLMSRFKPVHSQYSGWPWLGWVLRFKNEHVAKLVIEPGIVLALSIPWAQRAPRFSGLLFFVGICLFATQAITNHLSNQRSQSLIDAECEQRSQISSFQQRRGRG